MSKADKIKARKRRKMFWVPGRDRKDTERKPSGRTSQPNASETIDQAQATAKNNPDRRWHPDPASPHHGWLIGKLFLTGQLDATQYGAAERYIGVKARFHAAIAAQKETPQALDMAKDPTGRALWTVVADDEDMLAANRDAIAEWERIQAALADHSRVLFGWGSHKRLGNSLRRAVVESDVRDIGEVRQALNVLASLWKMRPLSIW